MVPVVQVGSKYDFEQSLVITVVASEEDPSVRCIFPENVPAGAEMTLIPAGGSISGTVNTLKLKGIEWPSGAAASTSTLGLEALLPRTSSTTIAAFTTP